MHDNELLTYQDQQFITWPVKLEDILIVHYQVFVIIAEKNDFIFIFLWVL